jgi:hypothetical protein
MNQKVHILNQRFKINCRERVENINMNLLVHINEPLVHNKML